MSATSRRPWSRSGGDGGFGRPAVGLGLLLAVALLAGAAPPAHAHLDYRVQPRDTLDHIARRHGTSISVIAEENGLPDPDWIVAGTVLRIPAGSGGGTAQQGGSDTTHHVVGPGETLSGIGARYGVSARRLAEWNGLRSEHFVPAGARISVAGPAAQNVAGSGGGGVHRIAPGETLGGIARRAGVSVGEIARANRITDPHRIFAGTTLTIPGGGGWHCPVRGQVSYVNDFGLSKPGGRFHDGVDIYAAAGTPVVAPVAGRVEQVSGEVAGRQFRLHGADGNVYIGTHMDSFGAAGQVQGGEVLGTVGTTGNARGTRPHLHFEIHADGGTRIINPHPSLRTACG